jgi:uncharacterized membrane protein
MTGWARGLTTAAALGAGVSAGVFLSFSTFVMPGLGQLREPEGIAAMQAINRTAPGPWLMTLLFGTLATSIAAAFTAFGDLDTADGRYRLAGAALFIVAIAVTAAFHIPRNDALALLDAADPASAAPWARYQSQWTAGNHVRTVSCAASALCFTLAR